MQVLAISEKDQEADNSEIESLTEKLFSKEEIFEIQKPSENQRSKFFEPVFDAALEAPVKEVEAVDGRPTQEDLPVVPVPEVRELNEAEEKRLRRKEDALLRELRIFLRSVT